jgi:glycosyltransferase involved in cell wall biosynthesis
VLDGGFHSLYKAIRTHKPALIHTHGYKAGIYGRLAAMLCGVPVCTTYHAGERGAFPVSFYQALDEKTAILADKAFAVSTLIQERVMGSTVLDNFIPVSSLLQRDDNPRVVAFVGRLSHEKAPDIFCQIAKNLHTTGIEFVVYGDGVMREALEREFGAYVTFKGFTSNMAAEWQHIGLLLMPSRAEGLPMAALEAMANGVPICASRVGGLPKLVMHNGWLFDSENMRDAMIAVVDWDHLGDKQLLAQKNHAHIYHHYNADVEIGKIVAIYKSLSRV